jgi:hypothetical protein
MVSAEGPRCYRHLGIAPSDGVVGFESLTAHQGSTGTAVWYLCFLGVMGNERTTPRGERGSVTPPSGKGRIRRG